MRNTAQVKTEKTAEEPKKRGSAVWKPADRLGIVDKDPKYRYKWVEKSPENLEKKHAEGWVPVNRTTGLPGEGRDGDRATDGADLTGAKSHRELILHAIPAELGEARDKYYENLTNEQTKGLKRNLERDLAQGGPAQVHGKIVIS